MLSEEMKRTTSSPHRGTYLLKYTDIYLVTDTNRHLPVKRIDTCFQYLKKLAATNLTW